MYDVYRREFRKSEYVVERCVRGWCQGKEKLAEYIVTFKLGTSWNLSAKINPGKTQDARLVAQALRFAPRIDLVAGVS